MKSLPRPNRFHLAGAAVGLVASWVSLPIVWPDPDFAICFNIVALLLGALSGVVAGRLRREEGRDRLAWITVVAGGILAGVVSGPVGWILVILVFGLLGLQAF